MPAFKRAPIKRKSAKVRVAPVEVPTVGELAIGLGLSSRTIALYLSRGCPRTSIKSVQIWRSENIKDVAEAADLGELSIENKRAEIAERLENARTRKLKNDALAGLLIPRIEVERDLSIATARLVNRLTSLGTGCATICPSELKAAIKSGVEDAVRTALKEFVMELTAMTPNITDRG